MRAGDCCGTSRRAGSSHRTAVPARCQAGGGFLTEKARMNNQDGLSTAKRAAAKRAVVKVGGGRGFVIRAGSRRLVITAGHCLPTLPPSVRTADSGERTYQALLGPLGENEPTVS